MLRYGIPAYRLPASYLDRDIDAILSTGVEVHVNTTVGQDVTFPQLREDYDSVYLAIGAGSTRAWASRGRRPRASSLPSSCWIPPSAP